LIVRQAQLRSTRVPREIRNATATILCAVAAGGLFGALVPSKEAVTASGSPPKPSRAVKRPDADQLLIARPLDDTDRLVLER
jgi:hypothetical protein